MSGDEISVDRTGKQAVDVLVVRVPVESVEDEMLPVADARHQLDTEDVCQPENRGALTWVSACTVSGWMPLLFL